MTVSEKMKREDGQTVRLYREGVFWVAYEQSACLLTAYKPLKVTKKYIKAVSQEVVSVGFPAANGEYPGCKQTVQETETYVEYEVDRPLSPGEFETWKNSVPAKKAPEKEVSPSPNGGSAYEIMQMVAQYPLAERSPLDALFFIKELQNKINS
jgi:hypothetical protein